MNQAFRYPCTIHHDGPIDTTHLNVTVNDDGLYQTSFRGRHLLGTALSVPDHYQARLTDATGNDTPISSLVILGHDEPSKHPQVKDWIALMECFGP
ncbi:hypothetical protein P9112_006671 [Eukaryota sp. TZLM1-RC]